MELGRKLIRSVLIFGALMVLVCVHKGSAQKTEEAKTVVCPKIEVMTMAGIPSVGGVVWFEVFEPKDNIPGLTYEWTVSIGNVDLGQSTKHIEVRYLEEMLGRKLTATETVSGLPENCPNTASESLNVSGPHFVWVLLSEYSIPTNAVHKPNLKAAVAELSKDGYMNAHAQLYIIEYFPEGVSRAEIKRKLDLVIDHLVRVLKFDRDRVTIVTAKSPDGKPNTKIFQVPQGAEFPSP